MSASHDWISISGEADGYDFSGPTRFDKLFTGIAVETPAWIKASTSRKVSRTPPRKTPSMAPSTSVRARV